jgi:hypothetical protein
MNQETGKIDNKNLMFSIENLAVRVISKGNYGIIDDEFGSPIPLCEVGPFMGRIMWFPPYNLNINESSNAKFEPTVMIGRNEPMYNYMNSERSATLSFTLLVDYPQHLKNYMGQNKQKEIAEFFAFGGDQYTDKFITIENFQAKETQLQAEIEIIKGKTTVAEPEYQMGEPIRIVFPNDIPKPNDNLTTIFDDLYKKYHYEIKQGCPSSDGTSWGLNNKAFVVLGLEAVSTPSGDTWIVNYGGSQYNETGVTDQFGQQSKLNYELFKAYNDESNRPLYTVYIHGAASKLYTPTNPNDTVAGSNYNMALGRRRAEATKTLVEKRLQKMFGKSPNELGIEVTWDVVLGESTGDVEASNTNATKAAIPNYDTKTERHALVEIKRNNKKPDPKPVQLSNNDKTAIELKLKEIEAINTKIRMLKDSNSCVMNERGSVDENGNGDTGILHGFQSVSGNYFYPVFHSQTPEDFHKRLTFLHQCQRQGAAKSWDTVDKDGNLRAKNSVFGRQPICILRIGDFFYTKVIIENYTVDYTDAPWDMNPEGFGMQPMLANITLQLKVIGGQSLTGPVDALQNAVSFNYYANSTFTDAGMYKLPSDQAALQETFMKGVLSTQQEKMNQAYDAKFKKK